MRREVYLRGDLTRNFFISVLILIQAASYSLDAQVIGGNSVFNFLKLSNTPQLTALGGVNISQPSNDIGMAFNNPALLANSMHTQLNVVFNDFYARTNIFHLSLGYHSDKLESNFSWGLHYFDYGAAPATDAAGNILGSFHPTDWVMQVSGSRSYLQKWTYGISLKFISSNYGKYRSNGVAADVGVVYNDTARAFSGSIVMKNAGTQLKKYENSTSDQLPFDLEMGLTQRLKGSPFSFSITAQHLQQYNIRYNDSIFNNDNGFANSRDKNFSLGRLVDHLILASTIYVGDRVEIILGYNFLRRRELNIGNSGNGLNGFSAGAAVQLGKLQLRYARAYYQSNIAFSQVGLNMKLNQYFGLGRFGERIKW